MINTLLFFLLLNCTALSYPTIPDAPISQPFGYQIDGGMPHVGMDFFIPVGTELYADFDGIVIQEDNNARVYGRYLMILHPDGNASLYAHLSEFKVKLWDRVRAGDLIALSGGDQTDNIDGDGWSVAPHLHWEIRIKEHIDNNLYNIDPLSYLYSCHNWSFVSKYHNVFWKE